MPVFILVYAAYLVKYDSGLVTLRHLLVLCDPPRRCVYHTGNPSDERPAKNILFGDSVYRKCVLRGDSVYQIFGDGCPANYILLDDSKCILFGAKYIRFGKTIIYTGLVGWARAPAASQRLQRSRGGPIGHLRSLVRRPGCACGGYEPLPRTGVPHL